MLTCATLRASVCEILARAMYTWISALDSSRVVNFQHKHQPCELVQDCYQHKYWTKVDLSIGLGRKTGLKLSKGRSILCILN